MKERRFWLAVVFGLCLFMVAGLTLSAAAKVPDGFRDVKLGMQKARVLDLMAKSPVHFSYEDRGNEIGEIVRGDNLFRYATYRFDAGGRLIEIGLDMREILGRDRILDLFNSTHGLSLSPEKGADENERSVAVKGNRLILLIKQVPPQASRSAEATR
jgi:hypothetical protein